MKHKVFYERVGLIRLVCVNYCYRWLDLCCAPVTQQMGREEDENSASLAPSYRNLAFVRYLTIYIVSAGSSGAAVRCYTSKTLRTATTEEQLNE